MIRVLGVPLGGRAAEGSSRPWRQPTLDGGSCCVTSGSAPPVGGERRSFPSERMHLLGLQSFLGNSAQAHPVRPRWEPSPPPLPSRPLWSPQSPGGAPRELCLATPCPSPIRGEAGPCLWLLAFAPPSSYQSGPGPQFLSPQRKPDTTSPVTDCQSHGAQVEMLLRTQAPQRSLPSGVCFGHWPVSRRKDGQLAEARVSAEHTSCFPL